MTDAGVLAEGGTLDVGTGVVRASLPPVPAGRAAAGDPARQDALLLRPGGRARRGGVAAHGRARVPDAAEAGHLALARARLDAGPAHQGEHQRGGPPPAPALRRKDSRGRGDERAGAEARPLRDGPRRLLPARVAAGPAAAPAAPRPRWRPATGSSALRGATAETKLSLSERVDTLEKPEEERAPLTRDVTLLRQRSQARRPAPAARERALRRPGLPGVPAGGGVSQQRDSACFAATGPTEESLARWWTPAGEQGEATVTRLAVPVPTSSVPLTPGLQDLTWNGGPGPPPGDARRAGARAALPAPGRLGRAGGRQGHGGGPVRARATRSRAAS